MRSPVLFLLAASCAALPDEVAVNTFTNQYDYLGGGDLKGLGSEEGNSTGIGVTATYRLKPTQMQLVSPLPIQAQDPGKMLRDAMPKVPDVGKMLWDATSEATDPFSFLPSAGYSAGAATLIPLLWWFLRRSRRGKQTAEETSGERGGKSGDGN